MTPTPGFKASAVIEPQPGACSRGGACGCVGRGREEIARVAQAGRALLTQILGLLETVDDRTYASPSTVLPGGTIGKHLRHTMDHFSAALVTLNDPMTVIDYDHRARELPIETDRTQAAEEVRRVQEHLGRVSDQAASTGVRIRVMLTAQGEEAELASTLGRELAFAAHHAVHHHAMIKAIAQEFGVRLGDDFGKAPSTMNYEHQAGQNQPQIGAVSIHADVTRGPVAASTLEGTAGSSGTS